MKYDRKEAREAEFTQSTASSGGDGQTGGPWGPPGLQREAWPSPAVIDGHGRCSAEILRAEGPWGEVTHCRHSMWSLSCSSLFGPGSKDLGRERAPIH